MKSPYPYNLIHIWPTSRPMPTRSIAGGNETVGVLTPGLKTELVPIVVGPNADGEDECRGSGKEGETELWGRPNSII